MTLSISLTILAGLAVFLLWRTGYQRIWPGLACALLGFSLASTGAAPAINTAISNITTWVSQF